MEIVGLEDEFGFVYKWVLNQNYVFDCFIFNESVFELGEFVGIGYVVCDIIQLFNVIEGEDVVLNFYGFLYGIIFGMIFVVLFFERVGYMVLDGNVNVLEWYDGVEFLWFKDVDSVLLDFFECCIDVGFEFCLFVVWNEIVIKFNDWFYKVFDDFYMVFIFFGSIFVLDLLNFKVGFWILFYGFDSYLFLIKVFDELFKLVGK